MRQIVVIGAGTFGSELVKSLAVAKCELMVIEKDAEKAKDLRDIAEHIVVADAADREVLAQFAKEADIAVVCIAEKLDLSVLITHYLKEIGVKRIIAKSANADQSRLLKIVGADDIVFPDQDEAKRLATSLISPDILDFIKLSEEFDIVEIACPDDFVGKSMEELAIRTRYGIQVIAVKDPLTLQAQILPDLQYRFRPDDIIVVIGSIESIQKMQKKLK